MNLRQIFITIMLAVAMHAGSQTLDVDLTRAHWEGTFNAGFNTDGWQMDAGVAYFPVQYIGVRASLGMSAQLQDLVDLIFDSDPDNIWGVREDNDIYASRFRFTSSVVLRSPKIIRMGSPDAGIYLFAEPGIVLSPGSYGSRHARIACWDMRCGINLQSDRYVFYLGYGLSNFALLSGYPYSDAEYYKSTDDYLTHSVFIGVAYKF
ncbi:MAG: hypothetical protein HFJ91_07835 [Muribaculaceae bacterium]|nr:hypothetical protein [Muribaculaceae bacterium]